MAQQGFYTRGTLRTGVIMALVGAILDLGGIPLIQVLFRPPVGRFGDVVIITVLFAIVTFAFTTMLEHATCIMHQFGLTDRAFVAGGCAAAGGIIAVIFAGLSIFMVPGLQFGLILGWTLVAPAISDRMYRDETILHETLP